MSEVNQDAIATTAVYIDRGTADVFAVSPQGALVPLGTLGAGSTIVPLDDHIPLRVIGREDAHLSTKPPVITSASLSTLRFLIGDVLPESTQVTPENYISILAPLLQQRISSATRQSEENRTQTQAADADLVHGVYTRIKNAIQELAPLADHQGESPLHIVLKILGDREGFEVAAVPPSELAASAHPLNHLAHRSGVRFRSVTLHKDWETSSTTSFMGFRTTSDAHPEPVALLSHRSGYRVQGPSDAQPLPLTDTSALLPQAFEFYAPLNLTKSARPMDLLRRGIQGSAGLFWLASLMSFGVALLGLLTPWLTNTTVGTIIPQDRSGALIQIGIALFLAAIVAGVFSLVQSFAVAAITQRATRSMQSALWDRMLSMPADFFRSFSSGDLTVRVLAVDQLQGLVSVQAVGAVLAAIFGLVNFTLMFIYSPVLGFIALFVLTLGVAVLLLGIRSISNFAQDSLRATRRANGWLVQMLRGITKIRIAGAESRMESEYLILAEQQAVAASRETLTVGRISAWFIFAISAGPALFIMVIGLSWSASGPSITTAAYLAFASAYGLAFAAITGLSSLISPLATARPVFSLLEPILHAIPEPAGAGQDPGRLTGRVELRDVTFRYTDDGPLVLRGLNLAVQPGEMVALVGPSGAGKSTITRLLLGFDFPTSGQVLMDGRDLSDLDLPAVRQQLGVVVQEGTITRGSIAHNILGTGRSDLDAAWAAAEQAALADDIRAMPMQMQTIIDPANISGGQAQRILLARALLRSPRIVILDEATSALDNAAQAHVTDALAQLNATRIVIAHRLSTIRKADRIIVIVQGEAVETGTYDDLVARDGVFTSLVKRQVA